MRFAGFTAMAWHRSVLRSLPALRPTQPRAVTAAQGKNGLQITLHCQQAVIHGPQRMAGRVSSMYLMTACLQR